MLLKRQLSSNIRTELDLTPMVDVIFQLLTFLLLTYNPPTADVDLPVARYGIGVDEDDAVALVIAPSGEPGAPAMVSAEGAGLLVSDDDIRAQVGQAVAAGRRRVILQADGAVPHGELLRIARLVGDVEGALLHIGVKEP